jgi:phosphopantothenoylcysteine decarboxylase/phosphopantothenate--cysteine ligase
MANVLLGIGASVAIHKSCDLASQLSQSGHKVRAILTAKAAKLVNPQLFEALTGEPAYTDEFGETRKASMDHIDLAKWGQVLVVAPCTADLLARFALGMADDLVATVALALPSDRPRLLCPAMNPQMLASPAVRRNLETLQGDGWTVMAPETGRMACGDEGAGRLPEPETIAAWVGKVAAIRARS